MPVSSKNKKHKFQKGSAFVDGSIGNYQKQPFFVKKANEAKAILKDVGLPKRHK